MITAEQARALVMAKDDIAASLASLNTKITDASTAGRMFIEEPIVSVTLGIALSEILTSLGYDARYQTHRSILKVKWGGHKTSL